ncbi:MAG: hypothetical protein MZV65_16875 [Chromatiales bacterium]|nr:hypothetical protein [Chromatiales bacterium]
MRIPLPRADRRTSPRHDQSWCVTKAEGARVAIRNIRRDANNDPQGTAQGKRDLRRR